MKKKIFNLEKMVFLIIFLLPVYLIKINISGIPTNLLEILISLFFVFWIFQKNYRANLKKIILENKVYFGIIFLIFIGFIASTVAGGNYRVSLGIVKGWFLFPVIFLLLSASILDIEGRKKAFLALFFSCFGVSLIALLYYFLGRITFDGRLQAIFNSPNYLAMYLAPAILVGYLWVGEKIRNKKFITTVIIFLMLIPIIASIYFTFSYASWIALGLSLVMVIFSQSKNYKKVILVIFLIAISFSFQIGSKKFKDLVEMDDRSSFSSRMMIWTASKKIIIDNWFWGIGPGNFQDKYLEYQKYFPPYLQWAVSHPHNLYLDFWLYSGIIGLVGFLGIIVFLLKDLIIKKQEDFLRLVAFGILIYVLTHGVVDATYFKNDLAAVFWMILLAVL